MISNKNFVLLYELQYPQGFYHEVDQYKRMHQA